MPVVRLNEDATGQASLFPTEAEQIKSIAEAESASKAPSALSFSQEEIDHFLRIGSNSDHARMRIMESFSKAIPHRKSSTKSHIAYCGARRQLVRS